VALWDEVKDKLKKILSGGATTTVMYCPCSAIKPSILLMDEPTSTRSNSLTKIEEHLRAKK
jgi:ABC-type phosphate transport system ATPase subunit